MSDAPEVLVVGAGPAGTSAALALAESGRRVRVLDAGLSAPMLPPVGGYVEQRIAQQEQWRWQLGEDYSALGGSSKSSPKLRVPGLRSVFADYAEANRVATTNFTAVGALAAGGLSVAWGCGVARYDATELRDFPVSREELDRSYARVAPRLGISGRSQDGLKDYFGLDQWADDPIELDAEHALIWRRARAREAVLARRGMRIGRARIAVRSRAEAGLPACDREGLCLWGCPTGATWSAARELARLRAMANVGFHGGIVVEGLVRDRDEWLVQGRERVGGAGVQIKASQVVLAAGTLATTRLVLKSLPQDPGPIRLLSNPMAAFLLLLPSCLGAPRRTGFGLAQLSFVLDSVQDSGGPVFGNLFSTCGLPVSEFLRYVPLARRNALGALRAVLSATIVGNCFLSGELSQHSVRLDPQGRLLVAGGSAPTLAAATDLVRRALRRHFLRLGAVMLPGSFVRGAEGADIHYAGTLPMKTAPRAHECWPDGSVAGLPGVFVADGASLPLLSSKAHTLTIMANADRIGRGIAGAA